jgi:uncharacterized protein (DUF1015 family)
VVEDSCLGRAGRPDVVVAGDCVQQLRWSVELLERPQSEVDMAEQASFLGRRKDGRWAELAGAADVVDERGGEQQIRAQPRMDLAELAAERRDPDRVLEQAAGVRVVAVRRRRIRAQRRAGERSRDDRTKGLVVHLAGEELEEAFELPRVAPQSRRQSRRVDALGRLERPYLHLELVAEPLDAAENPHRVACVEASVEHVDVVPHSGRDPAARVHELEREVAGAAPRAQPLLARDRVDALDGAVLLQLGDDGHEPEFRTAGVGTVSAVAVVRPFRALRYDPAVADLDSVVAPPYDVIGSEQREELLGRSPYNIVHLTLPDSEEKAAASLADWQERGVIVRDAEPACWWLAQSYVGPDGVGRVRAGLVAALRIEPYENRVVLPHERTHAGPKEGRLRLLRATRTQLEPLFFLWDGTVELDGLGEPELEVLDEDRVISWLWRLDAEFTDALVEELADAQLLIADGHHRYETALAFHEEDGTDASAWLLAVIVPTGQDGLTIFPTHRVAQSAGDASGTPINPPRESLPGPVLYRAGRYELLSGNGFLDPEVVDRFGPSGVTYTPHREEAVATVDRGDAEAAFLLRPTKIEDVWEVARRGEVMPQKSTFFYPKLTSGLLLLPLD